MGLLEKNLTYHEAQSSMELLSNYYSWTYGIFRHHITGNVVELGCGAGLGIRCYLDKAQKVFAVDHNVELLRRLNINNPTDKVETIAANLMADWAELSKISADTVIMMDILEHFKYDLDFLQRAANLLRAKGKVIIKVPAQRRLYSNIDEASGHFRRYEERDLKELAVKTGLRIKFIRHINPVGSLFYRLKRKTKSNFSKSFSSLQLKIINQTIPFIRFLDHIPVLPGLSLVCLMQRDG
jgi:SAM-dependent methyltransferase